MPENELIRIDHGCGVSEIRLNRAPVNALSARFLFDFAETISNLVADDSVRAIVLASNLKVFSAGLDLKEAQHFNLNEQNAIVKGLNVGFLRLFECPKPTVVAVNGASIAGGLFFVLSSDVRICSQRGKFGLAEVRVGADFPVGPLEIARATLGPNDLRRLMLTGKPVSAERALQAGIVDEIVTEEDLQPRALEVAQEMSLLPPQTFASVKRQIRGETIAKIRAALDSGANAPDGGWFNEETVDAMRQMIGQPQN